MRLPDLPSFDKTQVEYRKQEFFFSTSATNQGLVEEEGQLNPSVLLLLKLKRCCRVSDNIPFGLTSHYYFAANLSTREKPNEKDKSMVEKNWRVTDQLNAR